MEITPKIKTLIQLALGEDLGDNGDITSLNTIPADKNITVTMNARENGILAGIDVAIEVFKIVDEKLNLKLHTKDGDNLKTGQPILSITGNARNILTAERTALNFLSYLSGVASETARYVDTIKHTKAKILDTRKTLPGYRILQKHAVRMGGGKNHRMGLHDMVLIKDNHIASAGGVITALDNIKNAQLDVRIEIEVDTLEQLKDVIDHSTADIVLLDNMPPTDLKTAVIMCQGKIITEASGSINFDTVKEIAESGVDYISIGALTHSVKAFDIGLDYTE